MGLLPPLIADYLAEVRGLELTLPSASSAAEA